MATSRPLPTSPTDWPLIAHYHRNKGMLVRVDARPLLHSIYLCVEKHDLWDMILNQTDLQSIQAILSKQDEDVKDDTTHWHMLINYLPGMISNEFRSISKSLLSNQPKATHDNSFNDYFIYYDEDIRHLLEILRDFHAKGWDQFYEERSKPLTPVPGRREYYAVCNHGVLTLLGIGKHDRMNRFDSFFSKQHHWRLNQVRIEDIVLAYLSSDNIKLFPTEGAAIDYALDQVELFNPNHEPNITKALPVLRVQFDDDVCCPKDGYNVPRNQTTLLQAKMVHIGHQPKKSLPYMPVIAANYHKEIKPLNMTPSVLKMRLFTMSDYAIAKQYLLINFAAFLFFTSTLEMNIPTDKATYSRNYLPLSLSLLVTTLLACTLLLQRRKVIDDHLMVDIKNETTRLQLR